MGETCKLCLKFIQGDTVAALDEDLLGKLDFIQMDLERSVEESNSICTECKEKIQNAFDFKFCLVQTGSDERGASGSQTQNICDIPSTSSDESSTEKTICHLCKNFVAVISVITLEKLLKDDNVMEVFQGHIPELELQKSENSMVCEPCQKALASFSMLVSSWSIANDWNEDDDDMKEDMNDFGAVEVKKENVDEFSDSNTNSSCAVDASDSGKIVKKAKGNRGQITKVKTESDEESDSSESVSVNSKDVKKEESGEEDEEANLQLKDEEVDIKDEDGNGSECMPNLFSTPRSSLTLRMETKQKRFDEVRTYQCDDSRLLGNKLQTYECQECSYRTKYKDRLGKHTVIHKSINGVETHKCQECYFRTKYTSSLRKHCLIHKRIDELEIYQCQQCSFSTKHESGVRDHSLSHKSMDEVEVTYKCQECSFITKRKRSLWGHSKIHKSIDKVETYQCQECSFSTRHKHNLIKHSLTHKSIDEVKTYKCQECPYITKVKDSLRSHSLIHKSIDEVETYKCQECPYMTKAKGSLRSHSLIHKSIDEVETYNCQECSFITKHKHSLRRHSLIHSLIRYKCQECSFTTKHKRGLNSHRVIHSLVKKYFCKAGGDKVINKPFKTDEYSEDSHASTPRLFPENRIQGIQTNNEVQKYYECEICPFETIYLSYFEEHMADHLKHDDI